MHRLLCGVVLGLVLTDAITGCAPKRPMVAGPPTAMNALGGPTIVGDAAYGVTTSGGGVCRQTDGTIDAAGCGTMYRFEPTGQFTIVRSFHYDAKAPFGMPAATSDSAWFYGTTGESRSGSTAGPAIYRISRDGRTFQSFQHAFGGYSEVAVSDNAAYVFKNDTDGSSTLERVGPSGRIDDLANFPGKFGIIRPLVRADGSIAVLLNDLSCGVEIGTLEGRVFHTLFERAPDSSSNGRCFHSGEPAWGLAASNADLLFTNPHQIVRVRPDGSRATLVRLPGTLGDFVGNLVLRDGTIFALSASESRNDPVCMRLLRIRGEKDIDVVHAFERAKGRCLKDVDFVIPRLAVDRANFVITTTESPVCENAIVKEPATCGSIVWLRPDGTEIAGHDFVQAADKTDGAQRNLTTSLNAVDGKLRVTFLREGPPAPLPFTLDADGLALVMTHRLGRSYRVGSSDRGISTSHVTPSEGVAWSAHGQQIVTLGFPMPPDLPGGVYVLRLAPDPTLRDSLGAPLGVQRGLSRLVMTTTDAELRALRKRYLGSYVFGLSASEAACADGTKEPSRPENSRLRIVAIKREVGSVESLPLGDYSGFGFDPFLVILRRDQPTNVARGSRKSCSTVTITRSGTWDFERFVSLHQPPDPGWPARFRTAHIPMVGMTHAMVAAVWGYPRNVDTVAELMHENEWTYDVFDTIRFRGDRVSAVVMKNQP
jgi:hypothetical protein